MTARSIKQRITKDGEFYKFQLANGMYLCDASFSNLITRVLRFLR